jgi:hypothetical protein
LHCSKATPPQGVLHRSDTFYEFQSSAQFPFPANIPLCDCHAHFARRQAGRPNVCAVPPARTLDASFAPINATNLIFQQVACAYSGASKLRPDTVNAALRHHSSEVHIRQSLKGKYPHLTHASKRRFKCSCPTITYTTLRRISYKTKRNCSPDPFIPHEESPASPI